MDETKNDVQDDVEETLDLPAEPAEGEEDLTDWKAEAQKLRDKAIAQRERTKSLKQQLKDKVNAIEALATTQKKAEPTKTGELDETQLDYLDLKGISEAEDIKIIEDIVKKTGMTVRQALKDDYVIKKLEANKATREVKDATPGSTKRAGSGQTDSFELALAKYKQSNFDPDSLPSDFTLRSKIVNAIAEETSPNKPGWHG